MSRKLVSFRLPDNLMSDLKQKAVHDGISVTELVCRLLWHGLQESQENAKQNVVGDRVASLEAEIQALRQISPLTAHSPMPIYALLTQGAIAQEPITPEPITAESNREMRARLTRLEQMMETLIAQTTISQNAAIAQNK